MFIYIYIYIYTRHTIRLIINRKIIIYVLIHFSLKKKDRMI